jgi:hypothetical protein
VPNDADPVAVHPGHAGEQVIGRCHLGDGPVVAELGALDIDVFVSRPSVEDIGNDTGVAGARYPFADVDCERILLKAGVGDRQVLSDDWPAPILCTSRYVSPGTVN